jgi:hypothetical protein
VKKASATDLRRQIFVLTGEEQRILCFVLVAIVLGMAVKYYRSTRTAPAVISAVGQSASVVSQAPPKKKIKDVRPNH